MKRFHFKNNEVLDSKIIDLSNKNNCASLTIFIRRVLFNDEKEFLIFMNYYYQRNIGFKIVNGCSVNRKVSIPEAVYHGLKLCHKELDTYSMALIWRSFLIDIVECFETGGGEAWQDFKKLVIENGVTHEKRQRKNNKIILRRIQAVHIPGISSRNINKIVFFNNSNEFIGYLRC